MYNNNQLDYITIILNNKNLSYNEKSFQLREILRNSTKKQKILDYVFKNNDANVNRNVKNKTLANLENIQLKLIQT